MAPEQILFEAVWNPGETDSLLRPFHIFRALRHCVVVYRLKTRVLLLQIPMSDIYLITNPKKIAGFCRIGLLSNFIFCCLGNLIFSNLPMFELFPQAFAAEKQAKAIYIDELYVPYAAWRDMKPPKLKEALSTPTGKRLPAESKCFWEAFIFKRQGRFEEATEKFEKSAPIDKYSTWALAEFAQAYLQSGNEKQAYKLIMLAIKNGSVNGSDYELKAQIEGMRGNISQEAADYIQAAKLCSKANEDKCTRFLAIGADALRRAGKPEEAIKLLSDLSSYKIDKTNPSIHLERAKCLVSLKKYEEAIKNYTAAIDMSRKFISNNANDPRSGPQQLAVVNGYRERSKCYELMGKRLEASRDQAKFKELSEGIATDIIGK